MKTAEKSEIKLMSLRYPGEDIGIGTVLRALFIIFSLITLLVGIADGSLGVGLLSILMLLILLPYANLKFKERTGAGITRGLKIVILIILLAAQIQMVGTKENGGVVQPSGSQKTTAPQEVLMDLYKNEVYGFSIEYPKNWDVKESITVGELTAIVAFMGPIKNNFQTNVHIKTETVSVPSLNNYIRDSKESLSNVLSQNDYVLLDEGKLKINDQDAYFLEYAYNLQGYPLKVKQVVLMKGNNAYIVTYTSLQSTFNEYQTNFDNSVSTFKFAK